MEEIPSIYWMIVFGFLSFFLCLVLVYIVMLLKESRDTVRETREILKNAKESILKVKNMVDDLESTVASVKDTVGEISMKVLMPLKAISGVMESFKKHTEKDASSDDPLDELLSD